MVTLLISLKLGVVLHQYFPTAEILVFLLIDHGGLEKGLGQRALTVVNVPGFAASCIVRMI